MHDHLTNYTEAPETKVYICLHTHLCDIYIINHRKVVVK